MMRAVQYSHKFQAEMPYPLQRFSLVRRRPMQTPFLILRYIPQRSVLAIPLDKQRQTAVCILEAERA